MSLLIITATIEVKGNDVFSLTIKDTDVRLKQYLNALSYAIDEYKTVTTIIFCDNSNYKYDYNELYKQAKLKGKKLEVLNFSGDIQSVLNQGKGYGEGEILSFIFKNSKYVYNYESFYKLTGRLIIKNFDIINRSVNNANNFIYYSNKIFGTEHSWVSTIFYKANIKTYKEYLINVYTEVDDYNMRYLEMVFCKALSDNYIRSRSFNIFPKISGYSGSSGLLYDLSFKKLFLENLFNFVGLHDMDYSKHKELLCNIIGFAKLTVRK